MSSTGSTLPQPLVISSVPRAPATASGALSASVNASTGVSLSPAPVSASAAFSPYSSNPLPTPVTRSANVAMEGKSLFTCHQCGALLKFRANPQSIEEKIMRLRQGVAYEHPGSAEAHASPTSSPTGKQTASEGEEARSSTEEDAGGDSDSGAAETALPTATASARSSLNQAPQQTPVIVPEILWEQQRVSKADGEAQDEVEQWLPADFDPALGVGTFVSCNRGDVGQSVADVVPARLLNKPHLWVSNWEVDLSVPCCDADGWVYAASFSDFAALAHAEGETNTEQEAAEVAEAGYEAEVEVDVEAEKEEAAIAEGQGEDGADADAEEATTAAEGEAAEQTQGGASSRLVRRRRLVRKRRIDGSDLSWFQELLDCSTLLLKKRLPTCHDCETAVLYRFSQALSELEEDRTQYEGFLTQFAEEGEAAGRAASGANGETEEEENKWRDDPELRALQDEERRLRDELEAIEDETAQVTAKRRELWSTGTDLEHLIHGTFVEGAFLQHLLGLSRDERQSVGVFAVHASDMLRRLQRYNVCNDVFHIWHDGLFGTINGLRLGRLPSRPVEWVEINAALGQAVLLLATIADRANFEFSRNRLVPRGSFSRVVNMYGKEYSLYSDGGMFRRRGFNQAMVLFLECVEDAGRRAMKEEPSLRFPYKVERGKIGGLPISMGNDEQWTRALKYLLTHLKWLLAWISKRH